MPTLNWIQETAWDRYLERGFSDEDLIDPVYPCCVCGQEFHSISERDQHEVNHPVSNPTIFFEGREVCGEALVITSPLSRDGISIRSVEFLTVNGEECQSDLDLLTKIGAESSAFLDVRYGNENIERRLRINICIADTEELNSVDQAFIQCFEIAGLNDTAILAFTEKVSNFLTVRTYSDGLVRYIQGLMAKDNRSDSVKFEEFIGRFNQATFSLISYDTGLAHAVRSVVDFNRNDFSAIRKSGILLLDSAIDFFQGGELLDPDVGQDAKSLPVDYATESILTRLLPLYKDGSLEALEAEVKSFSPQYLSLQDKVKFDYIRYRKCMQIGDEDLARGYRKRLRFDGAFSGIIENENE